METAPDHTLELFGTIPVTKQTSMDDILPKENLQIPTIIMEFTGAPSRDL